MGIDFFRRMRKSNKKNLLFIVFFLSGCIMIGHGSRMIYQGVFRPESYYSPGLFDIFFDWATLLFLGIIVLSFSISTFYSMQNKKQKDKKEEKMFLNPS
jgi:formate hydrogenlyase subunit 3/multisubunit Na+/H+ antiporter MnhD subunit